MIFKCYSLKVNYNHVSQKLKEKLKTLMETKNMKVRPVDYFNLTKGGPEFVGQPQKPLWPTLSPERFFAREMFVAIVASKQHRCDAEGLAPLATLPCQVQSPALLCYKTAECPWRTELAANKKQTLLCPCCLIRDRQRVTDRGRRPLG